MPHIAEFSWMICRMKGLNMRSMMSRTVSVVSLCAGHALSANDPAPVTLEPSRGTVNQVAHIYYNAVSGERVVTLLGDGQTAPADTDSNQPIWSSLVQNACESQGYTTEFYFGLDDATGGTLLATGAMLSDYGDLPSDTVVDCIQINWVVAHPDTDLNSDGIGDGVQGLAGEWGVWDLDNGRAINQCDRVPLLLFQLINLPGHVGEPGELSSFTATFDLRADFDGDDFSFEICDTDGDCQTAAFCYSSIDYDSDSVPDGPIGAADRNFDGLLDSDLDGDGLSDWGWSVVFTQPGTFDFDDDGQPDGVPAPSDADTIGVSFGFPEGAAVDNLDGTWTWDIDTTVDDAGTGAEDRYALYEPDGSGCFLYNGGYWFGGFACEGGLIDTGGIGYTPPAMFQFVLYGPNACICCTQDINGDGELNFFDVSLFLQDYNAGGDYNGDGSTNFFDVSAFLTDFNAGCP
jgi:hypothetical protein